jgi:hypothetical protein
MCTELRILPVISCSDIQLSGAHAFSTVRGTGCGRTNWRMIIVLKSSALRRVSIT